MKNKKIGIIALVIFMIVIVSQNIMLMNKTNKLIGSSIGDIKYTDYLKASNVDYTSKKTVQDAIDEIYVSASESFLDRMYPIGSIYISTSLSTKEEVAKQLGGEWESYGSGRTLISAGTGTDDNNTSKTFSAGDKGGEYTHALAVDNLPVHNHSIPKLTGKTTTDGSHTHKTTAVNNVGSTNETGSHTHHIVSNANASSATTASPNTYIGNYSTTSDLPYAMRFTSSYPNLGITASSGSHTHKLNIPVLDIASSGAHSHDISVDASNTNGCTNCSGEKFSIQAPYITVYMYKRIN